MRATRFARYLDRSIDRAFRSSIELLQGRKSGPVPIRNTCGERSGNRSCIRTGGRTWRERRRAAMAVVPPPRKGSRTRSPSLEEARRMRSRRATGFCVGCLPKRFSSRPGGKISQTLFIWLPRLVSFIELVVEGVAALRLSAAQMMVSVGVGEIAAGKIGRRVGLDPGNVVQQLEIRAAAWRSRRNG